MTLLSKEGGNYGNRSFIIWTSFSDYAERWCWKKKSLKCHEKDYAQLDKKGLAIMFGLQKSWGVTSYILNRAERRTELSVLKVSQELLMLTCCKILQFVMIAMKWLHCFPNIKIWECNFMALLTMVRGATSFIAHMCASFINDYKCLGILPLIFTTVHVNRKSYK